ncbi:MAG: GNAT family N-acetyltransferase [Bacteroidetes bacterium]|nr:GNAT family N-acetyltransferase [Bacteroidota bacterium]MDA0860276.1 GNAT family N-acetyltransferase [Bacteroidota bacterium]MDA1318484.1 GNAT family N-acetyltransferase [Bacteroidota bacterium]
MVSVFVKSFEELSKLELYKILRLRAEVFIVEQDCVYQDVDDKDQKALHVLLKKSEDIIGYTRLFWPGDYFKEASIGRVVISKEERHNNYGSQLMKASILAVSEKMKEKKIKISAQTYLKKFYNNLDFLESGKEYLEDGIPHIAMFKE